VPCAHGMRSTRSKSSEVTTARRHVLVAVLVQSDAGTATVTGIRCESKRDAAGRRVLQGHTPSACAHDHVRASGRERRPAHAAPRTHPGCLATTTVTEPHRGGGCVTRSSRCSAQTVQHGQWQVPGRRHVVAGAQQGMRRMPLSSSGRAQGSCGAWEHTCRQASRVGCAQGGAILGAPAQRGEVRQAGGSLPRLLGTQPGQHGGQPASRNSSCKRPLRVRAGSTWCCAQGCNAAATLQPHAAWCSAY
jgi:hypothetical protein